MSSQTIRKKLKPLTQAEQNYFSKYDENLKKLAIISSTPVKPVVRKSKRQLKQDEDAKARASLDRQF